MDYAVDSLFRSSTGTADVRSVPLPVPTAEVAHIFMHTQGSDALPSDDVRYLGQRVAERSGLAQADAEKRVIEVYARLQNSVRKAEVQAKQAADGARKASAYAALWLFISLLIGAFVASVAAIFGGRQRDL